MSGAGTSALLVLAGLVVFYGAAPIGGLGGLGPAAAWAQEDWKKEFEEICSKTQDAMVFPPEELKRLIQRCDSLKPRIEGLEETQRKVFLKRLQLCRDLFRYVLESKEGK